MNSIGVIKKAHQTNSVRPHSPAQGPQLNTPAKAVSFFIKQKLYDYHGSNCRSFSKVKTLTISNHPNDLGCYMLQLLVTISPIK